MEYLDLSSECRAFVINRLLQSIPPNAIIQQWRRQMHEEYALNNGLLSAAAVLSQILCRPATALSAPPQADAKTANAKLQGKHFGDKQLLKAPRLASLPITDPRRQ